MATNAPPVIYNSYTLTDLNASNNIPLVIIAHTKSGRLIGLASTLADAKVICDSIAALSKL